MKKTIFLGLLIAVFSSCNQDIKQGSLGDGTARSFGCGTSPSTSIYMTPEQSLVSPGTNITFYLNDSNDSCPARSYTGTFRWEYGYNFNQSFTTSSTQASFTFPWGEHYVIGIGNTQSLNVVPRSAYIASQNLPTITSTSPTSTSGFGVVNYNSTVNFSIDTVQNTNVFATRGWIKNAKLVINYGDGTPEVTTTLPTYRYSGSSVLSHQYNKAGYYTLYATVYDHGGTSATYSSSIQVKPQRRGDYDGDGKTDISAWRPSGSGLWQIIKSSVNTYGTVSFGTTGDIPTPGDYDGDGKTDISAWRPGGSGSWQIIKSSTNTSQIISFGTSGDIPTPGDYDGDGKTDISVWRPGGAGSWQIIKSSNGQFKSISFGTTGDIPTPGDYDGDGKTDISVWRPGGAGSWQIIKSLTNTIQNVAFGTTGDIPTPGDYDGDGKTDISIWRPGGSGSWQIIKSSTNVYGATSFGTNGDIPTPGDYDGDGRTDISAWRPGGAGNWQIIKSSTNSYSAVPFGTNGDIPTN
jgi:hypothetical protein